MNEARRLQQAKQAIQASDKSAAQRFLVQVIKQNPESEIAWLWLSAVVDDPAKERDCLEQVLRINPDNPVAKRHLADLIRGRMAPPPSSLQPAPKPAQREPAPSKPAVPQPAPEPQPAVPRASAGMPQQVKKRRPIAAFLMILFFGAVALWFLRAVGPYLSGTSSPTDRPSLPTDTPSPTLSPEDALRAEIQRVLGRGNRDVRKVAKLEIGDQIYLQWAIDDNLTENLIRIGARNDVVDVLEAVSESQVAYRSVRLLGTFPMVDQFGRSEATIVVDVMYTRQILGKINWEHFLSENVYVIADEASVHPAFW